MSTFEVPLKEPSTRIWANAHYRLWLLAKLDGWTNPQIAEAFGVSPVTVNIALKTPEMQDRFHELVALREEKVVEGGLGEVRKILEEGGPLAARTLIDLIKAGTKDDTVRLGGVNSLLTKIGFNGDEGERVKEPIRLRVVVEGLGSSGSSGS